MANINLLPWREELRRERQRQFLTILGLVFALAAVVVFAYIQLLAADIGSQRERNTYLNNQIRALDNEIKEIQALEKERLQLIERMEMITSLQQSRPKVVRIFDELVRAVPEGLNLKSITRKANNLSFDGVAESSQRVTAFMRNVDNSEWFDKPALKDIDSDSTFGAGRKSFTLIVNEVSSKEGEEGSEEAAGTEGE